MFFLPLAPTTALEEIADGKYGVICDRCFVAMPMATDACQQCEG
jgi:hypothetical protein